MPLSAVGRSLPFTPSSGAKPCRSSHDLLLLLHLHALPPRTHLGKSSTTHRRGLPIVHKLRRNRLPPSTYPCTAAACFQSHGFASRHQCPCLNRYSGARTRSTHRLVLELQGLVLEFLTKLVAGMEWVQVETNRLEQMEMVLAAQPFSPADSSRSLHSSCSPYH